MIDFPERHGENTTMDFRRVLKLLIDRLDEGHIPYALIGGVALGLLGYPRGTQDIDLLVRKDDMPEISAIMKALGYETFHSSENVTQFAHPLAIFGVVDFLHSFREPTGLMLQRASVKQAFSGQLSLKVVRPEDLIGLKMQAIKNDPSLKGQALQDILALMRLYGRDLNWDDIRAYAEVLKMEDEYERLRSDPAE